MMWEEGENLVSRDWGENVDGMRREWGVSEKSERRVRRE